MDVKRTRQTNGAALIFGFRRRRRFHVATADQLPVAERRRLPALARHAAAAARRRRRRRRIAGAVQNGFVRRSG